MLRDRRIVFVLKSFLLGGAERQAIFVARHLATERGARVHVVGYADPQGPVAGMCESAGIPHEIYPVRLHKRLYKLAPALLGLSRHLRRLRPEVLIPFLNVPDITCGVLWRFVGARASIWSQRDNGSGTTGRRIEKWAIHSTPYFVANSREGADFLITAGAKADRVRVIANAVDLAPPRASPETWRQRLGVSEDHLLVAMVAHFRRPKDHLTLLAAWASTVPRLHALNRRASLVLAGSPGPTYDASRKLARSLQIDAYVCFLGEVGDVSGLLKTVDLGVHSSLSEGCPNAVQELMAAGLALVATDLPGIRDIMEDPEHLVPKRDPEALARHLVTLLTDSGLRRRTGERNRRRAETAFNPQEVCAEWDRLIEECLARSS